MTGMWQPDHSGKILSRKTGAVHDRIKSGKHRTAIETGLNALQKCFAEGNNNVEGYLLTGPVRYGQFMHGTDANLENERLQEQRFATALVTEVLRLIDEGQDKDR